MERWIGKVAIVTGASSGIGAAITVDLCEAGLKVIGAARRLERVEQLKNEISISKRENLFPIKCDVSNEEDIKNVFKWADENVGGVDVLINNAGIGRPIKIIDEDNSVAVREIIDTNLTATIFCCREAFKSMKKRQFDGHIILINSIAGHMVPYCVGKLPSFNVYPSTKYGVTALTEVLRQEFQEAGTKIKISSLSPGCVYTEIFKDDFFEKTPKSEVPFLESKDISEAVLYILGTPSHVQIHELIIKPVGEKF